MKPAITTTVAGFVALGLVGLGLAAGCGAADYAIEEQPLTGSVGGQAWSFAKGATSFFLSDGQDDFFASLHASDYQACGFGEPDGDYLIVAVPKQVGEFDFGLSRNMTFVVGDAQNLVATDGIVRVDEVTATTVRGGLHGVFDGDNEVSGTFELTICPDDTP